jgi:hypothetical protein
VFGGENESVTAEIRIRRRERFFHQVCLFGNVGFGEAYVSGDWDTGSVAKGGGLVHREPPPHTRL